ncbi:hypothetical protein HHI36_005083 [Cryptolaemus montrouzieri]|uniref:Uncharacterized protein n=1 Tax=Cryptolaemus montrouzieri TaxID=559131 RepID=A0ABD2NT42_9CUCU
MVKCQKLAQMRSKKGYWLPVDVIQSGCRSSIRPNTIINEGPESNEETNDIKNHLKNNLLKYRDLNSSSRPKIPRMTQSKEMLKSVNLINSLIQGQVADVLSIGDLVDLVYAGAVTV